MHYFPHDVKLRQLAHSRSFLANQKARNAIVGAENLLNCDICMQQEQNNRYLPTCTLIIVKVYKYKFK